MLKEIYCDKFVSYGKVREPIRFHKGLNTVLGSDSGSNSIGKSTFLMILDFIFGGTDYIEKSDDVHKNIGPHNICFTFEFDSKEYFFSRSTVSIKEVNVCDSNYIVLSVISLNEYNDFLKCRYGFDYLNLSFRATVGKFFRIYLRECCDEGHPLKVASRVSDREGIIELIKLFHKYEIIDELMDSYKKEDEMHRVFKKAIKFSHISSPANKKEYRMNEIKIIELNNELTNLLEESNTGSLDIDYVKAKLIADIKRELSALYRQRSRLKAKKATLGEDCLLLPMRKEFDDLVKFFPNADVRRLSEVEIFHTDVIKALKEEYNKRTDEIEVLLYFCDKDIKVLETKINSIGNIPNVAQAILDKYADLKTRRDNLSIANENFDKEKELSKNVEDLKKHISNIVSSELLAIEQTINARMSCLNRYVFNAAKSAPVIHFKDASHYSFDTLNDSGTGSRYKGMILFDLALLEITPLPVIAHDSLMLKQIEDQVLEKLFELYSNTSKQVFIAIDKKDSYTKRAGELLEKTTVLKLSPGGNELFGSSWNVIESDEQKI